MWAMIKRPLTWVAHHLRLWSLVFRFMGWRRGQPLLVVFTFHRVLPTDPHPRFLQGYERGLALADHERQIAVILRHFRVIDLATFIRLANGEAPPPGKRPLAMLTYDDADSDHRYAFDALRRRDLPAVSFVPTRFVGTDRRFYHLRLTNLCNQLTNGQWREVLASGPPTPVRDVLGRYAPDIAASIQEVRVQLIEPFEDLEPVPRDQLLTAWEEQFDVSYELGIECLSWDELREWSTRGIALGSHTARHERLELIAEDETLADLAESRESLEAEMGQPITTVCYPAGSYATNTPRLCREAGYELGFASDPEFVRYPISGQDRYLIPRIGVSEGRDHDMAYSIGIVAVKALLGKLTAPNQERNHRNSSQFVPGTD